MHEPLPRRGLLAALLLVLAACNPPEEEVEVPWTAPDAPGPWTASTEVFETTGSSGVALTIQVWYPASQVDDELYVYDDWMMGGAYEDGIPDCAAHRPVVLFSHGNMSFRYQSFFLTEHLARHGYVVVAPDHFGNTLDTPSIGSSITSRTPTASCTTASTRRRATRSPGIPSAATPLWRPRAPPSTSKGFWRRAPPRTAGCAT
jgi:hypothetical protein